MRSLAFLAVLALIGACKSGRAPPKEGPAAGEATPKIERTKVLYEVLDERSGQRVGFVEKTTYSDDRVVYWVTGTDREVRHGYMLPNNAGYKYEWVAGQRAKEATFIGADTYQANARRILGYTRTVKLREIAWEDLLKEHGATPVSSEGNQGQ